LQSKVPILALAMALSQHSWIAEALIHQPDRSVQYASTDYTNLIELNHIQISARRRRTHRTLHALNGLSKHCRKSKYTEQPIATWMTHGKNPQIAGRDCIPPYAI
jgi:hypothetical protein